MSRKCETCFKHTIGKCPFNHACKFQTWERFGVNWAQIRFKEIEKLERSLEACQTYHPITIKRAPFKEDPKVV